MKGEKAGYWSEGEAVWICSVGFWKAVNRKCRRLERTEKQSVERWDGGRQSAICQTGGLAVERKEEQYGDCMFTQCSALIIWCPFPSLKPMSTQAFLVQSLHHYTNMQIWTHLRDSWLRGENAALVSFWFNTIMWEKFVLFVHFCKKMPF